MPKVVMLVNTRDADYGVLRVGDEVSVSDDTAKRWHDLGLAANPDTKAAGEAQANPDASQRTTQEQELHTASLHGDVEAARALDVLRAQPSAAEQDEAPAVEEAPEPEAQPEPEPKPGTTARSARKVLGR